MLSAKSIAVHMYMASQKLDTAYNNNYASPVWCHVSNEYAIPENSVDYNCCLLQLN